MVRLSSILYRTVSSGQVLESEWAEFLFSRNVFAIKIFEYSADAEQCKK